jgi:creatinine amidohydrolase
MKLSSRWWWDLSSAEFAAADMSNVVAVLPVAAVEQHGPHLPVRVDAAINAGIVARAVELFPDDLDVLVLPALPVGKSDEHLAYPGTLTLSADTLTRLWCEVGESVWRAGCRKIILFNSHGGQVHTLDIVCRDLRVRFGMLAVACSWFRAIELDDLFSTSEIRHGIHAGEIETSVMLHLWPDLAAMDRAADFVPLSVAIENSNSMLTAEGGIGFGWQAQDLHPSGASGNAAVADAERGAATLERAARALVRLVGDAAAFDMERFAGRTIYQHG